MLGNRDAAPPLASERSKPTAKRPEEGEASKRRRIDMRGRWWREADSTAGKRRPGIGGGEQVLGDRRDFFARGLPKPKLCVGYQCIFLKYRVHVRPKRVTFPRHDA